MNSPETIREAVVDIVNGFSELPGPLPADKDLYSEMGIKSVNFISFLLALEDRFSVSIDDIAFTRARTLDSLIRLVHETAV